jgi:hypothetical protein
MNWTSSVCRVPTRRSSAAKFIVHKLLAGVALKPVDEADAGLSAEGEARVRDRVREIEDARREAEQRSHDVRIDS